MSNIQILHFAQDVHGYLLDDIVELHVRSIEHDGALLRFHPPFDHEKRARMREFWIARLARIDQGLSVCFMAVLPDADRLELCGMVDLGMPDAETGPFRGDVELLMVSPDHRRKGLGNVLMHALEEEAEKRGRTLLQLGTTAGSAAADHVYPRLGYKRIGTIPNYGITPGTGVLVDGEYFYKDLKRMGGSEE